MTRLIISPGIHRSNSNCTLYTSVKEYTCLKSLINNGNMCITIYTNRMDGKYIYIANRTK